MIMTLLRTRPLLIIGLMLGAGLFSYGILHQTSDAAPAHNVAEPLVSLSQAQVKLVPLRLSTQGHVVSLNQVDIQSQVTGTVKSVAFKEGDFVQQGQLLFTLDDSTQQATLRRAVATLAESHSELTKAQNDLARGRSLKAKNYISASDWDTLKSTQQQYAAQSSAAQQDIETAQAQLGYTKIYAPVSGKTGALNVHIGSLVQPGSTLPMVSINQFDPVGVSFTLPEASLDAVLAAQSQGPVKVWVKNARGEDVAGQLDFINNTVSTDSGTVVFKARFSNADHLLWPGAFEDVSVDAGSQHVVVLPPQAVQNGPEGHFVFLVDSSRRVSTQAITLLRMQQGMAIVNGVAQGTRVVVEGANALRPDMTVRLASHAATQEPRS